MCFQSLICLISVTIVLNLPKEMLEDKAVVKQLSLLLPGTHDLESLQKCLIEKEVCLQKPCSSHIPFLCTWQDVWILHLSLFLSGKMKDTLRFPIFFFFSPDLYVTRSVQTWHGYPVLFEIHGRLLG